MKWIEKGVKIGAHFPLTTAKRYGNFVCVFKKRAITLPTVWTVQLKLKRWLGLFSFRFACVSRTLSMVSFACIPNIRFFFYVHCWYCERKQSIHTHTCISHWRVSDTVTKLVLYSMRLKRSATQTRETTIINTDHNEIGKKFIVFKHNDAFNENNKTKHNINERVAHLTSDVLGPHSIGPAKETLILNGTNLLSERKG